MSLSQEQTRFVIEGLEKNLDIAPSWDPERKKYVKLWVLSIAEAFLVMAVRSAMAGTLAYVAWNSWPSPNVFNTGLLQLAIGDIGWAILAALCALAAPYALLAPWK
jgi:hypothetical protein